MKHDSSAWPRRRCWPGAAPPRRRRRPRRPRRWSSGPSAFPPFTESQLPNGLRMLVVENHALPVANLNLYVRSGCVVGPGRTSWGWRR